MTVLSALVGPRPVAERTALRRGTTSEMVPKGFALCSTSNTLLLHYSSVRGGDVDSDLSVHHRGDDCSHFCDRDDVGIAVGSDGTDTAGPRSGLSCVEHHHVDASASSADAVARDQKRHLRGPLVGPDLVVLETAAEERREKR